MNQFPRTILRQLVGQYGRGLTQDPRRCKSLLNDYCGECKLEVNLLVAALEEGVTAALLAAPVNLPRQILVAQLARRLHQDRGLAVEFALWATVSWGLALGVLSENDLKALPPQPAAPPASALGRNRVVVPASAPPAPGQASSPPPLSRLPRAQAAVPSRPVAPFAARPPVNQDTFALLALAGRALVTAVRWSGRTAKYGAQIGIVLFKLSRAVQHFNGARLSAGLQKGGLGALAGAAMVGMLGLLAGALSGAVASSALFLQVHALLLTPLLQAALEGGRNGALVGAVAGAVPGAGFGGLIESVREFRDIGGAVFGVAAGALVGWAAGPALGGDSLTGFSVGAILGSFMALVSLGTAAPSKSAILDYVSESLAAAISHLARLSSWGSLVSGGLLGALGGGVIWGIARSLGGESTVCAELAGAVVGLAGGALVGANPRRVI